MTDVLMPALTDQMHEGTIAAWLARDGETVAAGLELVEIETDKATVAHAAQADGVLRIVAAVGETLAVGELIARIGESEGRPAAAQAPAPLEPTQAAAATSTIPAPAGGSTATPLARRVASVHGVDLAAVGGSGPRGRVTRRDVLRAAGVATGAAEPAARKAAPAAGHSRVQQPTRLQQIVARRMAEVAATVPQFQVQTEVAFDAALALRARLKDDAADGGAPSVNDIVVKACALALRQHPLVNGSFKNGAYELHEQIHIGIAVASDEGLLVATVPNADTKSLGQIARDARRLAERARTGTAAPHELTGATFTVSNLGMFGMTAITPVINPPQAAILGVGAARPTLVRDEDGQIVSRRLLTLTLSCDHRILNGADGARYLFDVKETLEHPLRLVL